MEMANIAYFYSFLIHVEIKKKYYWKYWLSPCNRPNQQIKPQLTKWHYPLVIYLTSLQARSFTAGYILGCKRESVLYSPFQPLLRSRPPPPPPHCGFKWVKYVRNKFTWSDFTSFSNQFSADLHHSTFPVFVGFFTFKTCQIAADTRYDHSISRIFKM